jgi:hypothetical protein
MTTKRDVSANKDERASVRRDQLGKQPDADGPQPGKSTTRREKSSSWDEDPDAGIHDA